MFWRIEHTWNYNVWRYIIIEFKILYKYTLIWVYISKLLLMNFLSSFDLVLDALTINYQNLLHLLAKYTTLQHFLSFLPFTQKSPSTSFYVLKIYYLTKLIFFNQEHWNWTRTKLTLNLTNQPPHPTPPSPLQPSALIPLPSLLDFFQSNLSHSIPHIYSKICQRFKSFS